LDFRQYVRIVQDLLFRLDEIEHYEPPDDGVDEEDLVAW
jgi:hypothetical protein